MERPRKTSTNDINVCPIDSQPIIVGKKWEPRNPVPGPFLAKIRKVDENSESSQKIRKVVRILGKAGG